MSEPTPDAPSSAQPLPWRSEILAWAALGLLIRVLKVTSAEPWLDEACSLELARLGPVEVLLRSAVSEASPHPPLYFSALSLITSLLGEGLGPARIMSLVPGAALIALSAEAGRRLAGKGAGRLAALWVCLSPLAIHYSVEIRGYSLLCALSLAACLSLARYFESGQRRSAVWAVALFGAASMTHFYALVLWLLPLCLWVDPQHPDRRRRALLGFVAVGSPAAALLVRHLLKGAGGTAWIPSFEHPGQPLLQTLAALSLGTRLPDHLGQAGLMRPPAWSHWLGLLWTTAGLAWVWLARGAHKPTRRALSALALLVIGAPLLGSVWRPLYLPGRYELPAMAACQTLAIVGWWLAAQRLLTNGRLRTLALACVMGGLSLGVLPRYLTIQTLQPFSLIAMNVLRVDTPKTVVVMTHLTGPPLAWQLRRGDFRGASMIFPAEQAKHPCWIKQDGHRGSAAVVQEASALVEGLRAAHADRVFVSVSMRGRKTRGDAAPVLAALRKDGWRFLGSRVAGSYGVAHFVRRR